MKKKWVEMYLDFAERAASESHAVRLKVGAVFVSPDGVMSMGINGLPAGGSNVCEEEYQVVEVDFVSGTGKAPTETVKTALRTKAEVAHAEENLFAKLMKAGVSTKGGTIFITHEPCINCAKIIVNAGVAEVYFRTPYSGSHKTGTEWLKQNGVTVNGEFLY